MSDTADASVRRVMRLNYAIGAAFVLVAALTQPRAIALGVAVGVALTIVNFHLLARQIMKWTKVAATGANLTLAPKMILLLLAVVAALKFLPIDAIGFAIGYSTFVLSIMIEAVYANLGAHTDG